MLSEIIGRKGVSLERLRTLCLIEEAGGIMAAAQGDSNRQTLFSRQVKELETALGIQLLDRSATPHGLSEAGARIEDLTREFVQGLERVTQEHLGERPLVTLGAGESIIQWLLEPNLKAEMGGAHVRLKFRNLTSAGVIKALRSRRIEIGVIPRADVAGNFKVERLASYGVVAIAKKFPRERAHKIRWDELDELRFVVLEGQGMIRRKIDELQPRSKVAVECTSYPQVIQACGGSGLVGFVPEVAKVEARKAGLQVVEVEELSDLRLELSLVSQPAVANANPAVERVLKRLRG